MSAKTVLLVEDDELIGKLLVFILQRDGYQVEWLKDGQQAQELVLSGRDFNAVVLDLMLPFFDGLFLLELIRNQSTMAKVPVLILTSKMGEEDIALALKKGADDYLIKPFQPPELSARLRRLIGKQG
ncbi:response regulator transcription factor [Rheinheimera sp. MM224]|uniref:response regulator transcription factor n=1 Tax=Rheinheimera sp. MM224 TaxID=3019969 RepID=UPI0021F8A874|nr:response regulator transcription factor [Rheinheimera sp. MM224]CAI3806579.1 Alkaline phosphatase synthesis transcriptional regulatory protein PhoP [Rheinheimera sp. MM224]